MRQIIVSVPEGVSARVVELFARLFAEMVAETREQVAGADAPPLAYSLDAAAAAIGISRRTLERRILAGSIAVSRETPESKALVELEELQRYLAGGRPRLTTAAPRRSDSTPRRINAIGTVTELPSTWPTRGATRSSAARPGTLSQSTTSSAARRNHAPRSSSIQQKATDRA